MTSALDRFWIKVDKSNDCWLWTAGCFGRNQEYGCFYPTHDDPWPAHRWIYDQIYGIVHKENVIDHECRNTKCVRPCHLREVSHKVNILIGEGIAAKEAMQTECSRGHSLKDAHILKGGRRDCRQCRIIRNSRRSPEYRKVHG